MELFNKMIATALKVSVHQVDNTLSLLAGGATIPFISRYRKEATGGLDEVQIGEIKDRNDKLRELAKRKETILSTIEEQGKLTDELRKRIEQSWDATEVEDLYLPYKPKRKTRAEAARQKGLEPLATLLLLQRENHLDSRLPAFVKGDVKDEEEALKGARDIIAEQVNEDERARNQLRNQFSRQAVITAKVVKGKEEEAAKYRDYFDFSEPLKRCSSHRLLAIRRGEAEGLLKVSISPDDEECTGRLEQMYVRGNNECSRQVGEAVRDAYKRLLKPSIETEFSALSKEKADEEAIRVFAGNLRQLLLAPPLGQKRVMGVDPGYRTGCKIVCLDAQGALLHNETIYPHPPKNEYAQASRSIVKLVEQYQIEAIAIGNGTASRETEQFITSQRYDRKLQVFVVSEDGAPFTRPRRRPRRVPRIRCDRARSRLHWPPADGSAGRTGENRRQIHRSRTIPARCGSDFTEKIIGPDGGKLREPGRREPQYRQPPSADLYIGTGPHPGPEHCGLPHRKRSLRLTQGITESTPDGSESI